MVNCSGANIKGCGLVLFLYRLNVSRLRCGSRCSCCMLPAVCVVCWLKCRADQRAAGADKKKRAAVVAVPLSLLCPCFVSNEKVKGLWAIQKSFLNLRSLTGAGLLTLTADVFPAAFRDNRFTDQPAMFILYRFPAADDLRPFPRRVFPNIYHSQPLPYPDCYAPISFYIRAGPLSLCRLTCSCSFRAYCTSCAYWSCYTNYTK